MINPLFYVTHVSILNFDTSKKFSNFSSTVYKTFYYQEKNSFIVSVNNFRPSTFTGY